jgi:type II secretory ATPase GspE/PulE/Tfp pilus assembly ATPase PilB-like protein
VKKKKLGEMLIQSGLITETQLLQGLERQKTWGGRLGSNLVMIGALKEGELLNFLSAQTGVKQINLAEIEISSAVLKKVPQKVVEQFNLVPVYMQDKSTLVVALADPTDLNAIDQVAFITGHNIVPMITSYSAILHTINKYYLSAQIDQPVRQEIKLGEEPAVKEGFVADRMENHGGRAALADPDLILFGDQSEEVLMDLEPPPAIQPLPPISQPEISEEPELNQDLLRLDATPEARVKPVPQAQKIPSNSSLSSFSMEQRIIGMYHVMLKKRLITEAEIAEELMKLWALGKL